MSTSKEFKINTFGKWLREHQDRDDPVGDLAKDIDRDEKSNGWKWNGTIKDLRLRVMSHGRYPGSAQVQDAVENAWDEYRGLRKQAKNGPCVRADMIDCTPSVYPKVIGKGKYLAVCKGRNYEIPDHPIKVLGLLHHLAGKDWADSSFFFQAIQRIAEVKGWKIHPFQHGPTE